MRAIALPSPSSRIAPMLAVYGLALATGGLILWSTKTLETRWVIALAAGLSVFWLAVASGRFERFMLGLLFLVIPINADIHFNPGVAWEALYLPRGAPRLAISASDLILCFLYPLWVARLLAQRRSLPGLWPTGASPLVGLIAWSALSIVNAPEPRLSGFLLVGLIKAFLCFFYIAHNIKTRDDVWLVGRSLILGLLLESLIALAQHAVGGNFGLQALGERPEAKESNIGEEMYFRVGGTLGHPNFLGGYLSAVLPVAWALSLVKLSWMRRAVIISASLLGTVVLILTLSRSAWFSAAVAGLLFFGWFLATHRIRIRWLPVLLLIVLLGATLVGFGPLIRARWFEDDGGSAASRVPQNRVAWSMIQAHPLLGVGLNNYNMAAHLHQPYMADQIEQGIVFRYQGRLHNVYLYLAAEIGLMGLVWVGWFLWVVARRGWEEMVRARDDLTQLLLLGILMGLFARSIHEAVHTGHFSTNPFFWVYPAVLVGRKSSADE